jgi:hypothetical protein
MQNRWYSRRLVSLSTNSPGTGCVAALRPIAPDAQLEATDDTPTTNQRLRGTTPHPPAFPLPPGPPNPPASPPSSELPGGRGHSWGGVAARSDPPSPYGLRAPTPFAIFLCSGGTRQHHTSGVTHIGKHGWRKQQRRAHQTCRASPPNPRGRNCHSLCNINRKANARCSVEVHLLPVNSTTTATSHCNTPLRSRPVGSVVPAMR